MKVKIVITCEHAGNKIPAYLKNKIQISKTLLSSHKGWDIGALEVAKHLQKSIDAKLFFNEVTRLLIDYNRDLNNQTLYKHIAKNLERNEKNKLINQYEKYREDFYSYIKASAKKFDLVLLFSVHSFTPYFKGIKRKTDIGVLFRPNIRDELVLAQKLRSELKRASSLDNKKLSIHFNRPYRGYTDCLLNDTLDEFKSNKKVNGLFLEINQKYLIKKKAIDCIKNILSEAIKETKRWNIMNP